MKLIGHEYIKQTRAYCDYLEEHFNNITKAYKEVVEVCSKLDLFKGDLSIFHLIEVVKHHDVSKFSSNEFTQYRDKFFPINVLFEFAPEVFNPKTFNQAWEHHYTNNTHHWESATTQLDVIHMVIDWTAMSYKFGGTAQSYYEANLHKIKLQPDLIGFMYIIFNKLKD